MLLYTEAVFWLLSTSLLRAQDLPVILCKELSFVSEFRAEKVVTSNQGVVLKTVESLIPARQSDVSIPIPIPTASPEEGVNGR